MRFKSKATSRILLRDPPPLERLSLVRKAIIISSRNSNLYLSKPYLNQEIKVHLSKIIKRWFLRFTFKKVLRKFPLLKDYQVKGNQCKHFYQRMKVRALIVKIIRTLKKNQKVTT